MAHYPKLSAELIISSNIRLNEQRVRPAWEDNHAAGQGSLRAFNTIPNSFATWNILCLFPALELGVHQTSSLGPVQVLRIGIHRHGEMQKDVPGFTVSYQSSGTPTILRLVPDWSNESAIVSNPEFWRTASLELLSDSSSYPEHPSAPSHPKGLQPPSAPKLSISSPLGSHSQISLKAHIQSFKSFLSTTFTKARDRLYTYCSHFHNQPSKPKKVPPESFKDELGDPPSEDQLSSPDAQSADILQAAATTTSTAHALPSRSASAAPPDSFLDDLSYNASSLKGVKVLGFVLVLFSFFTWIFLRLRDPRLRADRAARREERRNRRLYRRAAQYQKVKRWFCSWRHRGHRCTPVGTWEEKQARVLQQEEVLEGVMKEGIRKLRRTHRQGNNLTAAEEGRNDFLYDSDDSRHRSRETLPGYESEGTQPPGYDDEGVGCDVLTVADGFRYVPAESDVTPDSSVISTSPRTSRDERDSDFGKDFEPLTLGSRVV
ncbi:MAG: hypothetical protein LQ351_001609 [Letrouitia transgressa]|nr:MAG: hypothetical protein LQ351_001609 [Letrouitia transgressa]